MATGSDYSHDRAVRGQNCARSELCEVRTVRGRCAWSVHFILLFLRFLSAKV
jgi:hypothetical protein